MKKTDYYLLSSVYLDSKFREEILDIIKKAEYKKVLENTSDVDLELLCKHASQASIMSLKKFKVSTVFLFIGIMGYLIPDQSIQSFYYLFIVLLTYSFIVYDELSYRNFVLSKIKDKDITSWPLKQYDQKLVDNVNKYKSTTLHYYKDYNPFSAEGFDVGSWSVAIDITKTNKWEELGVKEFSEGELYQKIKSQLLRLNFENISVTDIIYVNAKDIIKDNLFYENGSLTLNIDIDAFKTIPNSKEEKFRFYKVIKVKDWGNDLIFTILFRIYKTSESLYLETKYFVLPSIKKSLKGIDKFKKARFTKIASILISNILYAPILLVSAPFAVLSPYIDLTEVITKALMDEDDREELVGDTSSFGLLFRSSYYEDFNQFEDKDFYSKTIEKKLLNSIIDFLEEHNIDVSDFKDNKSHILNNGIIMSGGEMKADNLAVGNKNKLKVHQNEKQKVGK
jgi:hypothetical protein